MTPVYSHAARQLTISPLRFAPYRIESSSTLGSGSWTTRRVATQYQSSGTLISDFAGDTTPAREFYRVVTGP